MTERRAFVLWAVLGVVLLAATAFAKKPKPPLCPGGRFLVASPERLVTGAAIQGPEVIVVQGTQVAIADGCAPTGGRVRAARKGTQVSARWGTCGDLRKVSLAATIGADCNTMTGKRKAKKKKALKFQATRSTCGDGRLDEGGGEQCDGGACDDGQPCTGTCECPAPLPSTTSTSTTITTTTTVTTTTLDCGPAVCGNGTIEEPCETCDDGNTATGDSCPPTCRIEPCTPVPGVTRPVTVSFSGTGVAGISVLLDYPESKVSLPGTGALDPALFSGLPTGASSQSNDLDYALIEVVARASALSATRPLFTAAFDTCEGAPPVSAGEFVCTVQDASDVDGNTLPPGSVTCAVALP
jgi:cysteine-rich repeat protein